MVFWNVLQQSFKKYSFMTEHKELAKPKQSANETIIPCKDDAVLTYPH